MITLDSWSCYFPSPTSEPSKFVGYYRTYNCFMVSHSVSHASQQIDLAGEHSLRPAGTQLRNQLMVATRATSTNTSDCFKRALRMLLFQWVDVSLQMTAPLRKVPWRGAIAKTITLTF